MYQVLYSLGSATKFIFKTVKQISDEFTQHNDNCYTCTKQTASIL